MTLQEYIEANRLFWIEKGHLLPLHWTEESIQSILQSYFPRVWYNEESYVSEVGFEEALTSRLSLIQSNLSCLSFTLLL